MLDFQEWMGPVSKKSPNCRKTLIKKYRPCPKSLAVNNKIYIWHFNDTFSQKGSTCPSFKERQFTKYLNYEKWFKNYNSSPKSSSPDLRCFSIYKVRFQYHLGTIHRIYVLRIHNGHWVVTPRRHASPFLLLSGHNSFAVMCAGTCVLYVSA